MNALTKQIRGVTQPKLFDKDKGGNFLSGCFVGRPFFVDYQKLGLLVCDSWKQKAGGLPQGCFLLGFYKNEESISEALLLRVLQPTKLPTDSHIVSSMIEYYKDNLNTTGPNSQLDSFTRYEFSFSGVECRILGTFYNDGGGNLKFGADVENFYSAHNYEVYKPNPDVLGFIANYTDGPNQSPFSIGTVRYSSSRRFQSQTEVPVNVIPEDFLGKRTALFGMTRTGKSNTVKKIIEASCTMSDRAGQGVPTSEEDSAAHLPIQGGIPALPVGQIIFDINGEYANANLQDQGTAISQIYEDKTELYSIVERPGFKVMKMNLYKEIEGGFEMLKRELEKPGSSDYVSSFFSVSLSELGEDADPGDKIRYQRKKAAYLCCLHKAGFKAPDNFKVRFTSNEAIEKEVQGEEDSNVNINKNLTLKEAATWFKNLWATKAGKEYLQGYEKRKKKDWCDQGLKDILVMLTGSRAPGGDKGSVSGFDKLKPFIDRHTATSEEPFDQVILSSLREGGIIIVDLSQGSVENQRFYCDRICNRIFADSMKNFTANKLNNFIQFYFEEAHNLFPKKDDKDLSQIYNRLAKEGAKLHLGMIYATQEVSSISSNILKNTQNWFISHLNNVDETKELQKYYDFSDFTDSLVRFSSTNDKGFVRMKTYSSSYVVPTQISLFNNGNGGQA